MNFAHVEIIHFAFAMTWKQSSSSQQPYTNVNTQGTHNKGKKREGSKERRSKYISLKVVCEKKISRFHCQSIYPFVKP